MNEPIFYIIDLERSLRMLRPMIEKALARTRIAYRTDGSIPFMPPSGAEKTKRFLRHLINLTKSVPR